MYSPVCYLLLPTLFSCSLNIHFVQANLYMCNNFVYMHTIIHLLHSPTHIHTHSLSSMVIGSMRTMWTRSAAISFIRSGTWCLYNDRLLESRVRETPVICDHSSIREDGAPNLTLVCRPSTCRSGTASQEKRTKCACSKFTLIWQFLTLCLIYLLLKLLWKSCGHIQSSRMSYLSFIKRCLNRVVKNNRDHELLTAALCIKQTNAYS